MWDNPTPPFPVVIAAHESGLGPKHCFWPVLSPLAPIKYLVCVVPRPVDPGSVGRAGDAHLIFNLSHPWKISHLMTLDRAFDDPERNAADKREQKISPCFLLEAKANRDEAQCHSPTLNGDQTRIEARNNFGQLKILL